MVYDQTLTLQRELNQALIDGVGQPTILLVQHPPVITLTRRAAPNLLADEAMLNDLGIATAQTDRGGDITYHGPGQLVVYPILKLGDFGLNLSTYMRLLERAVIDTIATWEITGHTECGATGVWVDRDALAPSPSEREGRGKGGVCDQPRTANRSTNTAKICAMGVRIRKNTTMHGLALNVAPDMSHFNLIVPCGLEGRPVTSMHQLLDKSCPTMEQVKKHLAKTLSHLLVSSGSSSTSGRCIHRA